MKLYYTIIIFLFITLYAEDKDIFISSNTSAFEEIQTPMFFKFYSLPEYFDTSLLVEYDDIISPQILMFLPQVKKINLPDTVLYRYQQQKNMFSLFFSKDFSVFLTTKDSFNNKNINFEFEFNNTKVSYFGEEKKFYSFDTTFMYTQRVGSLIFVDKIKMYSNYLTEFFNQYSMDLNISKVVFDKIEFLITPQATLYKNENSEKLSFVNKIGMDFLVNKINVIFSLEGNYYNFDDIENFAFTTKMLLKDVVYSGNTTKVSTSLDKDNNLYYELELSQQTKHFEFSFINKKEIYHNYINTYFISLPYINVRENTKFYLPTVKNYSLKCGCLTDNFSISIFFDKSVYNKYPTYIFENDEVVPFYIDNQEIFSLYVKTKVFFVDFEMKWLLFDEVLFFPKLSSQIYFSREIFKNIYFLIKLLYNTKTKVATGTYIEENFVSEYKIMYKITEKLDIGFFIFYPLKNRYAIQPHMYIEPYIQIGLNFCF